MHAYTRATITAAWQSTKPLLSRLCVLLTCSSTVSHTQLGRLVAYHRGGHVWVEACVVVPPETSAREGREAALALQHQVRGCCVP